MDELQWTQDDNNKAPIIKIPLQFTFSPVQMLSKQLTKLNSNHQYRIVYLGPRWQNSLLFHKKYTSEDTYKIDLKRVNRNNNVLHDTMLHNQYYRNQIYYRAFQGMNPTLDAKEEINFQSRFESGNLDCVVKVNQNQYDLFLRVDSNTRGHISWFYFMIRNGRNKKIRFNICNLTKSNTHYAKGLNPFMYTSTTREWSQAGMNNVSFQQKKLRYNFIYQKMSNIDIFYNLSFQVQFKNEQEVKFAYSIPYTYSNLLSDIKNLSNHADVGVLGQSLTGLNIPVILFGKNDPENKKPVIIITGRVHPGETNSSLIISKIMQQLSGNQQFEYLRQRVLIVIIPMINPDGVILGNSRTGASGRDLNRQFKTKNHSLFPEVCFIKNLINKINQSHCLDIYLDFHGHSRKKNIFMFGPNYNISQSEYYKCRFLPRILSSITPTFRYYGCSYDISADKKSTARAVMLNQMLIPYVYTVQTSLGFYYDFNSHKTQTFDQENWKKIGQYMLLALKEHLFNTQQMELYLQQKKNSKKNEAKSCSVNGSNLQLGKKSKNDNNQEEILKQVKMLKLYREISQLQKKKSQESKKQKESEGDSDSHDERQNLQKEKMCQFTDMVTYFVEEQTKMFKLKECKGEYMKNLSSIKQRDNSNIKLRKRKENSKMEDQLFLAFQNQSNTKEKRNIIKTSSQQRKGQNKGFENSTFSPSRESVYSQQTRRQISFRGKLNLSTQKVKKSESRLQQADFVSIEKRSTKSNKLNIRMFNFSKIIQNPNSFRYQNHKSPYSLKHILSNSPEKGFDDRHQLLQTNLIPQSKKIKSSHQFLQTFKKQQSTIKYQQQVQYNIQKNNTEQLKYKDKNRLPSNYYRIKYHNIQKKNEIKKKNLEEFQQYHRITLLNKKQQKMSQFLQSKYHQKNKQSQKFKQIQKQQDIGLYAKISQFPLL